MNEPFDIKKFRPSFIKPGDLKKGGGKCLMCPNQLLSWVKYYCSSDCVTAAKSQGIYGNESN